MKFSNRFVLHKNGTRQKSKIKGAKKLLLGTVAASVGGLLSGLLFSPKSGKETRKEITNNIKGKTTELKDTISNKVTEAKENVTDAKVKISDYLNGKKVSKVNTKIEDTVSNNESLFPIVKQTDIVEENKK